MEIVSPHKRLSEGLPRGFPLIRLPPLQSSLSLRDLARNSVIRLLAVKIKGTLLIVLKIFANAPIHTNFISEHVYCLSSHVRKRFK